MLNEDKLIRILEGRIKDARAMREYHSKMARQLTNEEEALAKAIKEAKEYFHK